MADRPVVAKVGLTVDAILKERGQRYGGDDNLHLTAAAWDAYIKGLNGRTLTAVDVCHMMAMMKSMRVACGDPKYQDNHDDGAGFMSLAARINKGVPRL